MVLVVVFGLFNGFLIKNALATNFENNYIDNLHLTYNSTDDLVFEFHCKTSFPIYIVADYYSPIFRILNNGAGERYYSLKTWSDCYYGNYNKLVEGIEPDLTNNSFIAGNTYKIYLKYATACPYHDLLTKAVWESREGHTLTSNDWLKAGSVDSGNFWQNAGISPYSILAYFEEVPTLTITYPHNNDEIANIFNITGSFTQPAENPSSFLQADIMPTGTYISSLQSFWTAINQATSGNFSITIGNVSAGYYDFRIYFRGGANDFYQGALISNIHIVNDLPPFLPPWAEQPPSTAPPVFEPIATSTFSTSTGLYTQLTNTFAPMLVAIVSNLQQFSSNFTQTNASSTGTQIGQSVLLVRSYLSNLNSFFGNFPVSQFLLLYLIALVVVIVFRLVKGLIGLFKI